MASNTKRARSPDEEETLPFANKKAKTIFTASMVEQAPSNGAVSSPFSDSQSSDQATSSPSSVDFIDLTTPDTNPSPPPAEISATASFSATVTVNGIKIGILTQEKLKLEAQEFESPSGAIALKKLGRRILRIGGRDINRDGYQLVMPREPCRHVTILFDAVSCSATADGRVVFEGNSKVSAARYDEVASKIAEAEIQRASVPKVVTNKDAQAYYEWRDYSNGCLEDLDIMLRFPTPNLPVACPLENCTRLTKNGKKRPLRFMKHCRHDFEEWFWKAAGGDRKEYRRILAYEMERWKPTQFTLEEFEGKDRVARQNLRNCAGEVWKSVDAMLEESEKRETGYLRDGGEH